MSAMRFKSPTAHVLFSNLFRPITKKHPNSASFAICEENSIVPGDLTNGHWPRNCFHIITSSECGEFAHYGDVIMGKMTSQITSLIIVYSTVYSGADQRKHQSSAALAFVQRICFHLMTSSCAVEKNDGFLSSVPFARRSVNYDHMINKLW